MHAACPRRADGSTRPADPPMPHGLTPGPEAHAEAIVKGDAKVNKTKRTPSKERGTANKPFALAVRVPLYSY